MMPQEIDGWSLSRCLIYVLNEAVLRLISIPEHGECILIGLRLMYKSFIIIIAPKWKHPLILLLLKDLHADNLDLLEILLT